MHPSKRAAGLVAALAIAAVPATALAAAPDGTPGTTPGGSLPSAETPKVEVQYYLYRAIGNVRSVNPWRSRFTMRVRGSNEMAKAWKLHDMTFIVSEKTKTVFTVPDRNGDGTVDLGDVRPGDRVRPVLARGPLNWMPVGAVHAHIVRVFPSSTS